MEKLNNTDIYQIKKSQILPIRKLPENTLKYIKKHKVYITLTTDPERIKLLPVMLSLLNIENVYQIHINIPNKYRNEISYNNDDIKKLKTIKKVKVFRIKKDIGPITKMLPTIKRLKDNKSIIISIDDDIVYPVGFVNELIYQSVKYPEEIVTGNGFSFDLFPETRQNQGYPLKTMGQWWPYSKPMKYPFADVAEGFGSIAYKRGLVDVNLLDKLNSTSKFCKLSDDLTINYMLSLKGIKRRIIDNKYLNPDLIYPLSTGEEKGLHTNEPPGTYWDYNVYKYVECINGINNK
jgi:hypothetical protein